jgi:hypothetical protein
MLCATTIAAGKAKPAPRWAHPNMQVSSASSWPSRAAYVAAAVFLGASGSINLQYGWAKGRNPRELAYVGRRLGRRRGCVRAGLAGADPRSRVVRSRRSDRRSHPGRQLFDHCCTRKRYRESLQRSER